MAATIASVIVIATLALIFLERVNRTIVALSGAIVMITAGKIIGFYSDAQVIESIEFDALALLLGMMILVSILEPTGFFQSIAIKAGQLSKGSPWRLMVLLGIGTAITSLVLNNITTVVLLGPVTILIAEMYGLNPIPFLMAQAILSVTSAIGSSVGDPASMLIAAASGSNFVDFLTHAMPIVLVAVLVSLLMLRRIFSRELSSRVSDVDVVNKLDASEVIMDRSTMNRVLAVLAVAVGLFLFQGPLNLRSGFIALAAGVAALFWVQPDIREVLERVDWPVLLFFIGLFIVVGGLEESGAFKPIIDFIAAWGQDRPILLGIAIIWVVAGFSALVDNVPVTIVMISLLHSLAATGMDVSALWWAIVFGAGFGGNATSIGSGANIVIVSISERTKNPITPAMWSRIGLPIAFATCTVASILFALAFPLLGR
jgi:Na+/H+ antiporter NhaD/arsenite permease-like protein